jgi:3-oxoadipyl-CoA thiolase
VSQAYLCAALRTPIGAYGGSLAGVRTDDLAALPLRALLARLPGVDWGALDDVYLGCANQAGEDNRNVARMAALLAGLPASVPGLTLNRLCGSGLDAVGTAARAIRSGEADLILAGGVESMSRAPFVLAKGTTPFDRSVGFFDTTIGWRFVNRTMKAKYGVDSMGETAENVAEACAVRREDQDAYAFQSQQKTARAQACGAFDAELLAVEVPGPGKAMRTFGRDEHPRPDTTLEGLAGLKPFAREGGTVTAGNASGLNDGACALLVASESAVKAHGLEPLARVAAMATAGVEPRVMGLGPVPAVRKAMARAGLSLADLDLIELNEAFAAQVLAVLRDLGVEAADPRLNPNGGAIALGHPLGMSGARLAATAAHQLKASGGRYALATLCVGVGQGVAMVLERA